jgi:hypothetical protein
MNKCRIGFLLFSAVIILQMGCSKKSSSSSGGEPSASSLANIYGEVSTVSEASLFGGVKLKQNEIRPFNNSGCTVTVKSLDNATTYGTTTTDTNGNFYMEGLPADQYTSHVDCTDHDEVAVIEATVEAKTAKTPAPVNPRSTLIASMIMDTVLSALEEGLSGFDGTTRALIKEVLLEGLKKVIGQIVAAVEEAIESGTMADPTVDSATQMAAGMKNATSATEVEIRIFRKSAGTLCTTAVKIPFLVIFLF